MRSPYGIRIRIGLRSAAGADLGGLAVIGSGGGGGLDALSQRFDPLATQRVPFVTFKKCNFGPTDPKLFLKAHLAPIYTNFGGWGENQFGRPKKKAVLPLKKILDPPLVGIIYIVNFSARKTLLLKSRALRVFDVKGKLNKFC